MRQYEETFGGATTSGRSSVTNGESHHGSNGNAIDEASYKNHYDVIVVGGGTAGIGAAWGAAKAGASVLIVESEGCLGGAMTSRNVVSFCGLYTCTPPVRPVVGGIWVELRQRLLDVQAVYDLPYKHNGVFLAVDPEKAKLVLDELCADAGIDVLLHGTVVKAERQEDLIHSISVQQRRGQVIFSANSFVDASGDGDLSTLGGAAVRYGDKEGVVQLGSLATRFSGFSSEARPTSKTWSEAISKAKETDSRLASILHKNSSVLIPIPYTNDFVTFLATAKYDATSAASISRAEREGRKQAYGYLEILRKLEGHENVYLSQSGPHFGTRESMRAVCQYELQTDDVKSGRSFDDAIALGGWGMEYHSSKNPNWAATFDFIGGEDGIFEIPLGCLLSANTPNLTIAGRLVGAERGASASVRVMGTALATGQAAGVYAALRSGAEVVSSTAVREELRRQGAFIDRKEAGQAIKPTVLPHQNTEAIRTVPGI